MTSNSKKVDGFVYFCIHWLLIVIAFTIPFPQKVPLPFIWLVGLFWLFMVIYNSFHKNKRKEIMINFLAKGSFLVRLSFFLLIIIYAASTLYSSNLSSAKDELETKSLLIVLPLILFSFDKELFSKKLIRHICFGFLTGLFISTAFMLFQAYSRFTETGSESNFFYSSLSFYMHPGYLSLYIAFALGIVLWLLFTEKNRLPLIVIILLFFTIPYWIIFIVLLTSKAGFLSLILTTMFFFFAIIKRSSRPWLPVILLSVILTIIGFAIYNSEFLKVRISSMQNLKESLENISPEHKADGVIIRLLSWGIAIDQIKEAPLTGTGIGDYHDNTRSKILERDLIVTIDGYKNAHNQFLQTAATTGVFGLLALLMWLFFPFLSLSKPLPFLYTLFIVLVFFNFLIESMLERQAGVMFIVFFHTLFFLSCTNRKQPADG